MCPDLRTQSHYCIQSLASFVSYIDSINSYIMRLELLTIIALASVVAGQNQTVLQTILANPQGSTKLVTILNNLGPDSPIIQGLNSTTGKYTAFVPTDDAFQHASSAVINQTYGNFENLLLYHIVPQKINTTTNVSDIPLFVGSMLTNQSVNRYEDGRGLPVGLANIGQFMTNNTRVMPQKKESILGSDNQDYYLTKRQTSNNSPQTEVGYADGQTANIQTANVPASNGIIHYIDQVMMPPVSPVDTIHSQPYLSTIYNNVHGLNFNDTLDSANGVSEIRVYILSLQLVLIACLRYRSPSLLLLMRHGKLQISLSTATTLLPRLSETMWFRECIIQATSPIAQP